MRKVNNVLVTGGAGFMGSAFIRQLLSKGDFLGSIVNVDLLTYAGNLDNLSSIEKDPRYRFVKGDICDTALIKTICEEKKIDTIVHFAAETHVDRSISSPYPFIRSNIEGTFSLLEVVRHYPSIHFHHISTDEVYGALSDGGYFNEESPYRPNSPYSASKAASDHLVRSYHKTYGLSTTISHSVNNYGPFQYPEKLIPLMIRNCLEKKPLPIYGEGANIRDWIYVDDHAVAVLDILNKGKSGDTYGISARCEKKNIDLIHIVIDLLSEKTKENKKSYLDLMEFVKDRPGHDFRYAIDPSKLNHTLQWQPSYSFHEGLKKTISWYLNSIISV